VELVTGVATSGNIFVPVRAQCGRVVESSAWTSMRSTWAGLARHIDGCLLLLRVMSAYVKNLQFRTRTKSFQTCNGASVMVTSNSLLTEPLWSGHSGDHVRVSNFMAAYGRESCAWSTCVWKSVLSRAVLASGSIIKMKRRSLPLPVAVRDYIGHGCSAVKLGHWCERSRQFTLEQVPWEDSQRSHTMVIVTSKDGASDRPPTTQVIHHTRLYRQLLPSFPVCSVGRRSLGSRNHMLLVIHSM